MLLRKFLPAKLRAYDRFLLLNKPIKWATHVHILSFWALCLSALSIVLSFVVPVSLSNMAASEGSQDILSISLGILSILLLGLWGLMQHAYQAEGKQGLFDVEEARKQAGLYLLGLFLISLPPILPQVIVDYRQQSVISEYELEQDVAILNRYQVFFPISGQDGLNYYDFVLTAENDAYDPTYRFTLEPFSLGEQKAEASYSGEDYTWRQRQADSLNARISGDALKHIEQYLEISSKYLGENQLQVSAEQALEGFNNRTALYDAEYYWDLDSNLQEVHQKFGRNWFYGMFEGYVPAGWALFLFLGINTMIIARYLGLKQSIVAVVGNLLLYVSLIAFTGALGFLGVGLMGLAGTILIPVMLVAIINIMDATKKKRNLSPILERFGLAVLGSGHFYVLMFISILGVLGFVGLMANFEQSLYGSSLFWWLSTVWVSLMSFLHLGLILPSFHRAYLRLRAMPSRS